MSKILIGASEQKIFEPSVSSSGLVSNISILAFVPVLP